MTVITPIGLYSVTPTGPLAMPFDALVKMLSDGETLTLTSGSYDVKANTPTAFCDWAISLTPQ